MSTKAINWEILLIYFLLLIPWPPSQVVKMVCSKDNSRLVRKIVRSKWTPILDKHQVKLPLECPLHPLRDLYSPRQDAKKRDRPTQWTCRLCGKSFYQEKFLDLHFETRHKNVINEAEDAVCLADFCDIMRCEVFQTEESSSLKFGDHIVTEIEVWGENSALTKANAAYLSLLPIRTSALGATGAAKLQSQTAATANKLYETTTAATTATTIAPITNSKDGQTKSQDSAAKEATDEQQQNKSEKNSKTATETATTKLPQSGSDNATSNDGNVDKIESENATNSQKVRANCKAEELSKLKAKCEFMVRSCIGSLLLSMTDQSFKEMEEEMNKAVCWYLTCDRYWEDGPLERRAFPWGLILILIFVLSTGICFCYYIIWILFDSEETTINTAAGMNHLHHQQQQLHHGSIYMPAHQQQHHYYQAYEYLGGPSSAMPPQQALESMSMPQYQYYQQQQQQHQQQQQQQQVTAELFHEPQRYDYTRHSPRRYIGDQRQPASAPVAAGGVGHSSMITSATMTPGGVNVAGQGHQTPQHHHHTTTGSATHHQQLHHTTNLGYQQDILDRRDYTSRPLATTAVSNSATNLATSAVGSSGMTGSGAVGKPHYNTHPRPLASQHRHVGSSQQSLRASSSTHEIIQNEVGQNEHYIYVTYPPDLKKRFFEKYE